MTSTPENYLVVRDNGKISSYNGPEATKIPAMLALGLSIDLWRKTGVIPTKGLGIRRMMEIAKTYTGKDYAASKPGAVNAHADLMKMADEAKASLPVKQGEKWL